MSRGPVSIIFSVRSCYLFAALGLLNTIMRKDNVKTGIQQFPSLQGGASSFEIKPARAIRAKLYHLSGETSEIVLMIPRYTDWLEYMEEAQNLVIEYVNRLTKYWVKISHFTTEIGSICNDGHFKPTLGPTKEIIPMEKVFIPGTSGQWSSPDENHFKSNDGYKGKSKSVSDLVKIVGERKEEVYKQVDAVITLCGIPAKSRSFYFLPGESPSSFMLSSEEYLVVYQSEKMVNKKGGRACQ